MVLLRLFFIAWFMYLAPLRNADASEFRFTTVDVPGAGLTALRDINSQGAMVGFYDLGGGTHGFLLVGSSSIPIDFPGADATFAGGINDAGTIVGEYTSGAANHAFVLSTGFFSIDYPGSDETFGARINGNGDLSGVYRVGSDVHGFTLVAGAFAVLDVPGADATFAQGINDANDVVGFFYGSGTHGFLQQGTGFLAFDVPGADETFPTDLDNRGNIIGYAETGGSIRGFLRRNSGFEPIDFPGANNTYPQGINDQGLIVGFYDVGGVVHGFIATPIDEPGSLVLCLVATAAFVLGRRRTCRGWGRQSEHIHVRGDSIAETGARPGRAWPALVSCMLLLAAFPAAVNAQTSGLQFVFPVEGQTVAEDNLLLWAAVSDPEAVVPASPVVFEASTDGSTFVPLPQGNAPDFGLGSFTSAVDVGQFPVGSLFIRARMAGASIGPVVHVDVRRRPVPRCYVSRLSALNVRFDCSATQDENGGIVSYEFDFGDGSQLTSALPQVVHSYRGFGKYAITVTVRDQVSLTATLFKELVLVQLAAMQNAPACGCDTLTVNARGMSTLRDTRRPRPPQQGGGFEPAPLGRDPRFVTFNFEVSAALTARSDPALCTEGQRVRRTGTATIRGQAMQQHKRACTAGLDIHICTDDRDCDTRKTCMNGVANGQACDTPAQRQACAIGGGTCQGTSRDGRCTEFPFAGRERGNDDYRRPFPEDNGGVKLHAAATRSPIWIDFPGALLLQTDANFDIRYDTDFIAFVEGNRNCSCHFQVTVDWDGAKKAFRDATGIRAADGETANCRIVMP